MLKLEKNSKRVMLGLTIPVIGLAGESFLMGYHPFFSYFWMFPLFIGFLLTSILFGVIYIVTLVKLIYQRKPFIILLITGIILAVMFQFSSINSTITGSMTALYMANPEQVEIESRLLMQRCISDPNNCGEITDIPLAIQRLHPYAVDVTAEYTLIIKFRVFDDYGGFKILAPGKIVSGIKVRDGFYWVERRFDQ